MHRYGFLFLFLLSTAATMQAQQTPPPGWTEGPTVGRLGRLAAIEVPDQYVFLDAKATKTFLEQNQNIPDGDELGILLKVNSKNDYWFAVFSYSETGHVDDSDRSAIDAQGLMKGLKRGNELGNQERRKRGFPELRLDGWEQQPFYDLTTNNLTWSTRLTSEGTPTINHSVRLLGRTGTMSVQLVADPATVHTATQQFNEVLKGYSYNTGQRYAEFRQGDKLAGYGLTALIAGGAGAAAVKTGLLQKFWKVLVMIAVACAAGFKQLLAVLFRKREDSSGPREVPVPPSGS